MQRRPFYVVGCIMPQASDSGKLGARRRHAVFPFSGMDELCDGNIMSILATAAKMQRVQSKRIGLAFAAAAFAIAPMTSGRAAACAFAAQGEGRVAEIIDGRSFRLADGREIRLAGIETAGIAAAKPERTHALATIIGDHDVMLRGEDDAPDRYGRQAAFVFLGGSETLVQRELLAGGQALASVDTADKDCAAALGAAEAEARAARRGIWENPSVIKSAESPDDILSEVGRFVVVEGKVLSVRQAGATTYLNFGRNWTRGFAVTISRRMMPAFEAAGVAVKSLENRRVRVRGWIEAHPGSSPGPRIDVARVAQIELLNSN
jgi:endonuclease YncB( thermonuclease family)